MLRLLLTRLRERCKALDDLLRLKGDEREEAKDN